MTIHVEIIKDTDLLYAKGLAIIEDALNNGATTFGLATGGTMLPLYEKIRASSIDFSKCVSFNLDEYVGLPVTHQESYRTFMQTNLFDAKPFAKSILPDGLATDPTKEAAAYEEKLQNANLNFQLLGIGENGHIGFNEPGTSFDSKTHVVELTPSTRQANARFFNSIDEVPTHAITMGISSILKADTILLIAVGDKKRQALEALLKGDKTTDVPVTALQDHQHVIILTDLDI